MIQKRRGYLRIESGLLAAGVLLLAVCVYLLATAGQRVCATDDVKKKDYNEQYARFAELMAEVFIEVQDKYVEDVPPEKIFAGALNGMFNALDPHSAYLGADNFKELEKSTEGEFSGIGIHIDLRDGVLTVISPIPGTPAARAGLRPWDRIVKIEGKSTEGMTTPDAVKQLTGPIGSKVNVVIYRESERKEIPFTFVRDRIKIESIYSNADTGDYVTPYFKYLLKSKIGYARIAKFSEQATEDLVKSINRMKDAGVEGVVLDVRFDSGGLLDEAITVANLFLDKGKVVVATKGRLSDQNHVYKAEKNKMVDWPVILLINHGSASASEILAGALKDHHRAILLGPKGENTYGKGSVQTIAPLRVSLEKDKDGNYLPNAIRLTTAKYYTPDNIGPKGKSIDGGVGIAPDVTVELPKAQEGDLLTKGMLLGDPPYTKPGEEKEKTVKKDSETKNEDETESKEDTEEEQKTDEDKNLQERDEPEPTPTPAVEKNDEKTKDKAPVNKDKKEDDKSKPGAGKDDKPFYLKSKDTTPTTKDVQLRYAVDLLKALLIVRHEQ